MKAQEIKRVLRIKNSIGQLKIKEGVKPVILTFNSNDDILGIEAIDKGNYQFMHIEILEKHLCFWFCFRENLDYKNPCIFLEKKVPYKNVSIIWVKYNGEKQAA